MEKMIPKEVIETFCDMENVDLPSGDGWTEKLKCPLVNGNRIQWYYQDDLDYWKECGEAGNQRDCAHFGGIIVARPGIELRSPGDEMEYDQCIIVVDSYDCEKCYPETGWVALVRLLDDSNLIEMF